VFLVVVQILTNLLDIKMYFGYNTIASIICFSYIYYNQLDFWELFAVVQLHEPREISSKELLHRILAALSFF